MPNRLVILDESKKPGITIVVVGSFLDVKAPQLWKEVEGPLENAIPRLLELLKEWQALPPTSIYKPPEPKKETKVIAGKPAAGKTAEELPLLGTEPAPAEVKAEALAPACLGAVHILPEVKAEDKAPQGEVVVTPAPEQPAAVEPAPAVPGPEAQTPPAPAATPATPAGEWQYWLEDGRGPFSTVQEAMDAKSLDKATRPQHNRWDRLSTELKKAILRKPKT